MDRSKREKLEAWFRAVVNTAGTALFALFAEFQESAGDRVIALLGLALFGPVALVSIAELLQILFGMKSNRERIADLEARVEELEGRDRE